MSNKTRKARKSQGWLNLLSLPVIMLIGLLPRVIAVFRHDLIFDEGYTALAVRGIEKYGLPYLPSGIIYPRAVAYSYLSTLVDFLVNNEIWAIRIVSVVAGTMAIAAAYLIGIQIFKKKEAGLLSAILVAISPYLIEASRYGRFYALMFCCFSFSVYFALKVFANKPGIFRLGNLIGLILCAGLTIFSDTLGVSVIIPIFVVAVSSMVESTNLNFLLSKPKFSQKQFTKAFAGWFSAHWPRILAIIIFVCGAAFFQFAFERFSFYSAYRKLVDGSGEMVNVLNLPISFDPFKTIAFMLSVARSFPLMLLSATFIVLGLKFGAFDDLKKYKKSFSELAISSALIFMMVVLVAPQFQVRYFYIFYIMLILGFSGLACWAERELKITALSRIMLVTVVSLAIIFAPFWGIVKNKGSIPNQRYLPSSALDNYPDSKKAFEALPRNEEGVIEEGIILVSTKRKELEYYAGDFKGMKFLVVPWTLEDSLESMPLDIYEKGVSKELRKDLEDEIGVISQVLGTSRDEVLVDPVGGNVVIRPEEVINLVEYGLWDVYLITERFDYHPDYVSKEYLNFLEGSLDEVVYWAEDEGYSNVYGFFVAP